MIGEKDQNPSVLAGKRLLFVVNEARFLLSHRSELLDEGQRRGCDVAVICGADTGEAALADLGIPCYPVLLSRSDSAPLREWRLYRELVTLYRQLKPDLCHHVTIKPVIYGTRAARAAAVPAVVNAIPGMGFVFIRRGTVSGLRRRVVNLLYRFALRHPRMRVVFQNSEDLRRFLDNRVVKRDGAVLIRGSGVELALYEPTASPGTPLTFVLIGRMLQHKGVREFVEAARRLRPDFPDWRFLLVGDVDPGNPSSLCVDVLKDWQRQGVIEWRGFQPDIPALLANSNVVVLPSYREGLPKTLLEASAAGRPMIAADVPGCREVVRDGVNGLLVPARDASALAEAMRQLGCVPQERERMGRAARERAEALYRVEDVVNDTFLLYESLLAP